MIYHENCLPADNSHEISCLICNFWKSGKIWNCRLLQIIGGALRVNILPAVIIFLTNIFPSPWAWSHFFSFWPCRWPVVGNNVHSKMHFFEIFVMKVLLAKFQSFYIKIRNVCISDTQNSFVSKCDLSASIQFNKTQFSSCTTSGLKRPTNC